MWICDAQTMQFYAVNFAALKRYGWTRDEFSAMTMEKVLPTNEVRRFSTTAGRWNRAARD